ncbi:MULTISPECIES: c-type cytochrome [Paracoccaceae]|uniref:c-type cytochrome n=1 Tax=Rhodobacterales TaxID=204455 RepID=UPI001AFE0A8E|nr:cytochrome c family protein [Boseongicola sp. H5]MBO6603299.1 cytochrome c family protein [Roseicyclus sp.]MBO6624362.1 cytochrome c family protein [Roseicyclus sp.]MBO6922586.1 cytochrome c family protein [Roseicyclus sp.]
MFDTMTITKIGGAVCGALLIFLLAGWAADGLYSVGGAHDEDHRAGYVIDTGEGETEVAEEVVEVPFAELYAVADASAGERLWRQCSACHSDQPGVNGVGPYLHGVVGRPKHTVEGFNYSDGLLATTGDWTPENISAFIENPREYAPGTAMAYNGMRDAEDRANLIAFLDTLDD